MEDDGPAAIAAVSHGRWALDPALVRSVVPLEVGGAATSPRLRGSSAAASQGNTSCPLVGGSRSPRLLTHRCAWFAPRSESLSFAVGAASGAKQIARRLATGHSCACAASRPNVLRFCRTVAPRSASETGARTGKESRKLAMVRRPNEAPEIVEGPEAAQDDVTVRSAERAPASRRRHLQEADHRLSPRKRRARGRGDAWTSRGSMRAWASSKASLRRPTWRRSGTSP